MQKHQTALIVIVGIIREHNKKPKVKMLFYEHTSIAIYVCIL